MLSLAAATIVGAASFGAAVACTYLTRAAMRRLGIFDQPTASADTERRKVHRAPVAYEGGLAILVAFLAGLLLAAWFDPSFFFDRARIAALVIGCIIVAAVGVADDLLDVRPVVKLAAQLGVGALMYWWGFRVVLVTNPFGDQIQPWAWTGFAATILWYALLMNGLNMIDGLDGLAAGIAGISALTVCAISFAIDQDVAFALALVLAAVCAGFLVFNFSPASIFMGDAGSLVLGFLLASSTLLSSTKSPALLALLIPVLAVGLPIFETGFSFLRRAVRGRHPFKADSRHLHHRFLALGFSQRRTVLTFYYITAYLGVMAFVLQRLDARATLAIVAILGAGAAVLVENMRFLERLIRRQRTAKPDLALTDENESAFYEPATSPPHRSSTAILPAEDRPATHRRRARGARGGGRKR